MWMVGWVHGESVTAVCIVQLLTSSFSHHYNVYLLLYTSTAHSLQYIRECILEHHNLIAMYEVSGQNLSNCLNKCKCILVFLD